MRRPALKYFFALALWAATGLFAATWMGLVSLGTEGFAIASGALILLALAASWFIELLDRRLAELVRAAEEFKAGVRQVQLGQAKQSDVGALAEAFSQMAESTEKRIADLQATLQQQRFIADQSPDAMWVLDVGEFRFVDVNENFAQLSGYARNELIGKTPVDVSAALQAGPTRTEEYARALIERALSGEKVIAPWVIRTRAGMDIPCELRAVHVPSSNRTLLCGSLMDARQRLRTEGELAQRMRFENLIMMISSTMSGTTSDRLDASIRGALADIGDFAQVDRSYVFLFDDHGGVTCTHEWCATGITPQIDRLKNLKVSDYPWVETRLMRGEVVHVPRVAELPAEAQAERAEWEAESIKSILLVPVTATGRVRGYVGFDAVRTEKRWPPESMDVLKVFGEIVLNAIARVQAEAALRQQNETLAATVSELERSNEELQQFAYISSHDLQEPLRSIGGFSDLLKRHYGERLDARGMSYVGFINEAARRLHELIDGLLDYSRVGSRSRPFETCQMDHMLKLALDNLAASVNDSGARITHDPLPPVGGDAPQLTVLLQNLIGNALKFHGDQPPQVHVGVRKARGPDTGWEFRITDNGIGISPSDARKLFQVFKRLHPADKYPGTGVGLAIARRIVERHRGRIWIEPNPGGGTSLCFTLPAIAQSEAA